MRENVGRKLASRIGDGGHRADQKERDNQSHPPPANFLRRFGCGETLKELEFRGKRDGKDDPDKERGGDQRYQHLGLRYGHDDYLEVS